LDSAPQQHKAFCDAVEKRAWTDASTHVHWLKSSSAAVAARYLSELFQRIELRLMEEDLDGTDALMKHINDEFDKVCACLRKVVRSEPAGDGVSTSDPRKAYHLRSEHTFHKKKVLLVEDSRVNQELALDLLQQLGCVVECATNGESAVRLAETEHYDLILMDCQMPGMGGLEATRLIRQSERKRATASTTIVALTAHALQEDRNNCLAAGMDDHLGKPFLPEDFVAVLSRWLGPTSPADGCKHAAGDPSSEQIEPAVLDFYPVEPYRLKRRDTKKTWSAVDKRIWPKLK
jgi:CheY-like chemotaxis protein